MKEEIEAAALFITRLVNKNLSQITRPNACSSASSTLSHSSSSSASSSCSESHSSFDDPQTSLMSAATTTSTTTTGACQQQQQQQQQQLLHNHHEQQQQDNDQDMLEQFRQCLTNALFERFHDHWFPEQPTKGQAYRCIRLNEWDRHDIALQNACLQCGIDYKDLQLPVELTLWVDPDEVTCRFGETKGSHCLVAKFKDGHLKDKNFNFDI